MRAPKRSIQTLPKKVQPIPTVGIFGPLELHVRLRFGKIPQPRQPRRFEIHPASKDIHVKGKIALDVDVGGIVQINVQCTGLDHHASGSVGKPKIWSKDSAVQICEWVCPSNMVPEINDHANQT